MTETTLEHTDQPVPLPGEPEAAEWMEWAAENSRPGELLTRLIQSGRTARYPELAAIVDVPQDPEWHPEGPVHVHVGYVLDAAGEIAAREGLQGEERAVLILAALTHDLGKATTTELREKRGQKRWTSYGHDRAGGPVARSLLKRIGVPERIIQRVVPLVLYHMAYQDFKDPHAGKRTLRRLAARLAPATLRQLGYLIEADHSGRPPLPKALPESARRMLALAEQEGLLDGPP